MFLGSLQDANIGAIAFDTCTGVTLTGPANLTYIQAQWPFGQGSVVNISSDNLGYTIKVSSPLLRCSRRRTHLLSSQARTLRKRTCVLALLVRSSSYIKSIDGVYPGLI